MKTRIITIILTIITVGGVAKFISVRNKFNRFREIYIKKFENYNKKKLVADSYCNFFIEEFSVVRMWMIKEFFLNHKYKLKDLYYNNFVYKNMKASMIKDSGQVPFIADYNKIIEEWRKRK
jgi:hypothetical protein